MLFRSVCVSFFFYLILIAVSYAQIPDLKQKNRDGNRTKLTSHYLVVSHTREIPSQPNVESLKVDPEICKIDFKLFNLLLLGGDLTVHTSHDEKSLQYVDSVFDIKSRQTLWAAGNHDYSHPEMIEEYTGRKTWFTQSDQDITFLILDTENNASGFKGDQLELIRNVTDTISNSSNLVILMHKLVWLLGNPGFEKNNQMICNGGFGNASYQIQPNNFWSEVYPMLAEVQSRGIQVTIIGGDLGYFFHEYDVVTEEGIRFLATGILSGNADSKILVLSKSVNSPKLEWQFILLNEAAKMYSIE